MSVEHAATAREVFAAARHGSGWIRTNLGLTFRVRRGGLDWNVIIPPGGVAYVDAWDDGGRTYVCTFETTWAATVDLTDRALPHLRRAAV